MLLGVLIIFLISETQEISEHKYTIGINPLSFGGAGGAHIGATILLSPQVNFELKVLRKVSIDFELTNLLFIIPVGARVGVREYLGKKGFRGFYLHQGLGASFFYDEGNIIPPAIIIPYLTFRGGYKYVSKGGFTVDPFLGSMLWSEKLIFKSPETEGIFFSGLPNTIIIIWPVLGLYLGYTW